MEKIYKFSPVEQLVLNLNAQSEQAFKSLLPAARRSLSEALGCDSDVAWNAAFEVLLGLEERITFYTQLYQSTAVGYAHRAGVTAADGEVWSVVGDTISVVAAPVDDLAEVSALTGVELFTHPQYPALVAKAKDIFLEEIDNTIGQSTDASQIAELQDAREFIQKFSKTAVESLAPIETAVA